MSSDKQPADSYDVVILGGGLAGLTLGLQLKQQRPATSVFMAEKRPGLAPEAAFKVGESTVEVSAHYFADVLGLKDHLETYEIHKFGLRWWFPAAPGEDVKINPYAISLDPSRWEADGLFNGDGMSLAQARQTDAAGLANLFMEAVATPA